MFYRPKNSEKGFILVTSLVILALLTLLGLAAILTSKIELRIAGNDRLHKETFYGADGGTETGTIITYENALCINNGGFTADTTPGQTEIGFFRVANLSYAEPGRGTTASPSDGEPPVKPPVRDAVYYTAMGDDARPHTNFTISGVTAYTAGSGLQEIAGYESEGYGSATGGSHVRYTINAQKVGALSSKSTVTLEWRLSAHLINTASSFDCKY